MGKNALLGEFQKYISIVFELNTGASGLEEARSVLNIAANAKTPFNYTINFKSGKTESGFDYIDTADRHYHLDWYEKPDGNHDNAIVNMAEARWTGNADGSLKLDGKDIRWSPGRKKDNNYIERIIFIPAKDGYLANGNDWD